MKANFLVEIAKGNKCYAITYSVGEYQNLYHYFDCMFRGREVEILSVNYMPSKKRGEESARALNDYFRKQNKLLEVW